MPDSTFVSKSILKFEATRFENNCKFRCEAINDVIIETNGNKLHASHDLEVLYPPVVSLQPKNITVLEGAIIVMKCDYISKPSSIHEIIWYRDGERLNVSNSHYEGGSLHQPTLIIKNSSSVDMGKYKCLLANSVGNGTSNDSIEVNILYKPQVQLKMSSQNPILESEHKNVTLTCEVVSGNPPILDEVVWYLDGEILKHLPECNNVEDSECGNIDPSILLLQDTTRSFHGNYSCKGRNIVGWGSVSEQAELIVNYPPGPARLTYSPRRIIKGHSLVLTCSVEEIGRPSIDRFLWYRNGRLISDIEEDTWIIEPVMLDHRANFSCRGINLAGEGPAALATVDVLAPPSFKYAMNHYTGALYRSQNISLSCTVECAPLCSIQWLKDGQVIVPEKTDKYYVVERTIKPQMNRNDFEATESTLYWNMSAWTGGLLSRDRDVARYTCRSSRNAAGPSVSSTTNFVVEYEPEDITVFPQVVTVVENNVPVKFVCSAKGFPMPTYTWYREPKDHGKGLGVSPTISSSNTLVFGPVTRKDSGRYTCVASNKHSNVNASIILNIMFAPECRIKQIEKDGEQVLVCTAYANPSEVSFSWKLNNNNDSLVPEKIWQSGLQSFLWLSSDTHHSRIYTCHAANSLGASEPCEHAVEASMERSGKRMWWMDQNNLLLLGGIMISILIVCIIICIIIICIFKKIRTKSKQMDADNNPTELDENDKYLIALKPDVLKVTTVNTPGPRPDGMDIGLSGNLAAQETSLYENLPFDSCGLSYDKNTYIRQKQHMQMKDDIHNRTRKGKNKYNYHKPIKFDSQINRNSFSHKNYDVFTCNTSDDQHITRTLNRTRKKKHQKLKKLNHVKKSKSLNDKLSCVGLNDNYDRSHYEEPDYGDFYKESYFTLLKGTHIINSSTNVNCDQNYGVNFNTTDPKCIQPKNDKLLYGNTITLGNHNVKFIKTVKSNRHLYETYTTEYPDTNANRQSKVKVKEKDDKATFKIHDIVV